MQRMGFCSKWIDWIMLCVTTVSYTVMFNGAMIGPIVLSRGLRQGDPLSPYLFLLCVEGLSKSLTSAASSNIIHGCQISPGAPILTRLLFVDDGFLFFKANTDEICAIKSLLQSYERLSGQSVNFQKSGIFFSANVHLDKKAEISTILGVFNDLRESKYLGLPSLIGRSKQSVFNFLKDRVWKRIQGWSNKLLSRAGKAILIKNVAQALPSYCMSCFLIPKSICEEIQRMLNGYWWSSNSLSQKGLRWLSWNAMSMAKNNGGIGLHYTKSTISLNWILNHAL